MQERPEQPRMWKVAFTLDGKVMIEKPEGTWANEEDRHWLEKKYSYKDPDDTFFGALEIVKCYASAASAHIFWEDTVTGIQYPCLFNAFSSAIVRSKVAYGVLNGHWGYEKKGPRQGIYLIEPFDI